MNKYVKTLSQIVKSWTDPHENFTGSFLGWDPSKFVEYVNIKINDFKKYFPKHVLQNSGVVFS